MKAFVFKHLTVFRLIAFFIAFAMTAGLIWFAFALNGNPVSYFLVKNNAEKYVAENYPGYEAGEPAYNFKAGKYAVEIIKPDSEDCHFMAGFGLDGKCLGDNFESSIEKGFNTMARLNMRYRELVNTVLKSPAYPFVTKIGFGELIFESGEAPEKSGGHGFSLPKDILKPDALYDICELGENGGLLTICVFSEEKTPERAAEILRELDALMTQGGVTFRAIDLTLTSNDDEDYIAKNIHREEISESDLPEIVIEKHNAFEELLAEIEK